MIGELSNSGLSRFSFLWIWGLCFAFLFYAESAESQGKRDSAEILVIGNGRIINDNMAAARKAAISDALRKGMEQYLIQYLGTQGMINYFQRLVHDVIPEAREEIENFHILAEESEGRDYKVLASIKVNEGLMEEKLREMGIVLLEGPPIKLLFLVSQKMTDDQEIDYWWGDPESEALTPTELVLRRVFQERGFDPVNRLLSMPEEKVTPEMRKLELSDNDVLEWGRLFSADYVIFGESEIIENKMVSLFLKVFHVEKGELVTQDRETEAIPENTTGPDRILAVLEQIVRDMVVRLSPLMIESFKEEEEEVNSMEMVLSGLKSFGQIRMFKNVLNQDITGVTSITPTRIKGDAMTFLVEFTGKKETFREKIMGYKRWPYKTKIYQKEDGGIVIEIESSPVLKEETGTE